MKTLATISGVLGLAALLAGPVAAAPVAVNEEQPVVESSSVRLSSIGRSLLPVTGGFLVLSEADLGLTAVSFVPSDVDADGLTEPPAEVIVLGEVAAQGDRLVAVDSAGVETVEAGAADDPRSPLIRLFRVPGEGSGFVETGYAVLPEEVREEVRRFGTAISIGGNAIAVVSETTSRSDRVDIFRVSPDGTAEWSQELNPQTLGTSVAVSTSGATIALSGVNRLAASGEVIVNRIGPSGWVPTQRFLRIGGGAVHMQNDRILVQRNSFFARSAGPWTVIDSSPGRPYEVAAELPVEGDAVAVGPGVVVVGDSENDLVYVLEESAGEFRFSQAVRPPRSGPTGDSPQFGTSVGIVANRTLIVGAPGPGATDPAGEVFRFSLVQGPVGCTIVGSDADDELTSPSGQGRQTLCGLRGDDTLTGSAEGGTLDGGPGIDTCTQTGPATGPITTIDCEQ